MSVREHTVTAVVDPNIVWEHWTDPDLWAVDDPDVEEARLNGPLAQGCVGWIQRVSVGRRAFRIVEVNRSALVFTLETRLVLATLRIKRSMKRVDGAPGEPQAWALTQRVRVRGPLAPLWNRVLAAPLVEGMPGVMDAIVRAAS